MLESGRTYPIHFHGWCMLVVLLCLLGSCKGPEVPENGEIRHMDRHAFIFPDYRDITISFNIAPLNSDNTDSYHSWSGNSRWIVFSSRRYDGRYTRL